MADKEKNTDTTAEAMETEGSKETPCSLDDNQSKQNGEQDAGQPQATSDVEMVDADSKATETAKEPQKEHVKQTESTTPPETASISEKMKQKGEGQTQAPSDVEMADADSKATETPAKKPGKESNKPKESTRPPKTASMSERLKQKGDKAKKEVEDITGKKAAFMPTSISGKSRPSSEEKSKKSDKSKTGAGEKRKADEDPDALLNESDSEDKKEPDPHPLPEELMFGYAPAEAYFDFHKMVVDSVFRPEFEKYKQQLTDISKKKKHEEAVLLMQKDDCQSGGSRFSVDEYMAYVNKYRAMILTYVDYDKLMPELVKTDAFVKENDEKYRKDFTDKKKRLQAVLDLLPKHGCMVKFVESLRRAGYTEIYERMYTEETKPAKLIIDYEKKEITFKKEKGKKFKDLPVDPEPEAMETSPAPAAEGTSVDAPVDVAEEVAGESSDKSAKKPKDAKAKSKDKPKAPGDKAAASSKPGRKPSMPVRVCDWDYEKGKPYPYEIGPRTELDKDYKIPGVRVRYIWMNPVCNAILVSFWLDDEHEDFKNFWIKVNAFDAFVSFNLLNALRRVVFEDDEKKSYRLESFFPLCSAHAQVRMYKSDDPEEVQPEEDDYELKYVIFDEECISVYDTWHHETPEEYFMMHIEYTKNSIERIYYHGISGHVMQIDKNGCRCYINLNTAHTGCHKEMYDRIKFQLRTNMTPKPKDTWNFDDKATLKKWCEFCRGYVKYNSEDHLYRVPQTELPDIPGEGPLPTVSEGEEDRNKKQSSGGETKTEQSDDNEESETEMLYDTESQRQPSSSQPSTSGRINLGGAEGGALRASQQQQQQQGRWSDAGVSDETEALILQLQSTSIGVADQDQQMKWTINWSATEELSKKNLIPESGIESGALDENNGEHFREAIKGIKQTLMEEENEMPKALANLRGVAKVFSKSRHESIKNWLSSVSEENRLQQIFLVEL